MSLGARAMYVMRGPYGPRTLALAVRNQLRRICQEESYHVSVWPGRPIQGNFGACSERRIDGSRSRPNYSTVSIAVALDA